MKEMFNSYDMSIVFIVLFLNQFYLIDSNSEFIFNKLKERQVSNIASLNSLKFDKVCTRDHNSNKAACYKDHLGFEAIALLHSQIDDDHNGNLDRTESIDFLKEDLKRDTYSYDESHYHKNDDLVSVQDLWNFWVHSEVHNWTVDDIINWLDVHVELGHYAEQFRRQEVDGAFLPRLACSMHSPVYSQMGIKNMKHRQKISLKATDIVLFGIPKSQRSLFSDTLFFFSILLALSGCLLGYRQHKLAKLQLHIITNDLKNLQSAEDALKRFKAQLEESHRKQREEEDMRDELKRKLMTREFKTSVSDDDGDQKIKSVQEELFKYRLLLMEAELRLEECRRTSIPDLQQWLQLTYEIESKYIEERNNQIFKKLQEAKKMCESMRRQKLKLLSNFRNPTISPDFEKSEVKQLLEDIKVDLEERSSRWNEIERITSFNITTNPGIPYLNTLLRGSANSLLSVPGMMTSASMSKISTLSGHLNTYPIMSNLLKAGMQLSAVGINTCMIDSAPDDDSIRPIRDIPSQPSLASIDRNGLSSFKFARNHIPHSTKHYTPVHQLIRHAHNSMPTFYTSRSTLFRRSTLDRRSTPEENTNNNVKFKSLNGCNRHRESKFVKEDRDRFHDLKLFHGYVLLEAVTFACQSK